MRTPIDFLLAAIERRLAERISAGEGALAQALAKRYSAKGSVTAVVDSTVTVMHLTPAMHVQSFESGKFSLAGDAALIQTLAVPCSLAGKGALVVDSTLTTVHLVPVTSLSAMRA